MYANDNAGEYPDSLETLISSDSVVISPAALVCPESNHTPATGATTQAIRSSLQMPGHCSYIYLGKGRTDKTTPANAVIAYEPLSNHAGDDVGAGRHGMNVLFGDGHVDWESGIAAVELVTKASATSRPVTLP